MKMKHKRLFVPVINDIFGKEHPLDTKVEILPSEGYLTEGETTDGRNWCMMEVMHQFLF